MQVFWAERYANVGDTACNLPVWLSCELVDSHYTYAGSFASIALAVGQITYKAHEGIAVILLLLLASIVVVIVSGLGAELLAHSTI